jgi:insertion element IS1 protein InsB
LGIRHFSTDGADVYERHRDPEQHTVGKIQTPKIARKHRTFRTRLKRLVRTTIGFSRSVRLHDIVVGLLVNHDEFGMVL